MSYREEGNSVILTMSREDYDRLLIALEIARLHAIRVGGDPNACLAFINRLNSGNPNYTPYQVKDADSKR